MIEYAMQESSEAEAIRAHLGECAECTALNESVAETLRTFSAEPVPIPEFEQSWQRVRGRLGILAEAHPVETVTLLEEPSVFSSLWSSVRDVFFPEKLPPLELESKPIPVVDRMAFKRNPASTGMAIVIYALLILIIAYVQRHNLLHFAAPAVKLTQLEIPPPAPTKKDIMAGGGGQKSPTPVTKGTPPKFAETQIVPPKIPPPEPPKINIAPTVEVQPDVKMPPSLPMIGLPTAPSVGMQSMGNGSGTGLGSGNGAGIGPGSGGNMGGGLRHVGGGVSPPIPIYTPEPEFSEEARKAKFAGDVIVSLYVDQQGRPVNVRVIRGAGMGLDEKAIEAVKQYKFKPAMENGKPVMVDLNVVVNFQIF
jgi:periplasmic protein TonB